MDGLLLSFGIGDELHRWRDSERYTILLAGVQKRNGHLFGISTAGVKGEGLLWAMRERALELGAARDGGYVGLRGERFAWHEWSLAEDADHRDVELVKAANPAPWVTLQLLTERFESPSMTDVDWRRFSANQWVERAEIGTVIDASSWAALVDTRVPVLPPISLAVDCSMDREASAVAVAGFTDAAGEVPLVDIAEHGAGIAWAVERVVRLSEGHENVGVVVDPGGPAASLIPRLQEFGLRVHEMSTRELAQACTGFYDLVATGGLRHRGSEPLNQSVQGAVKRPLSQSWAFDRRKAMADPSPLLAATLALHGLRVHGPISVAAFNQRFGEER
jgi:hypothetical protein